MSLTAYVWAGRQQAGSPLAKLILLRLADGVDCDGFCSHSLLLLATHCEVSDFEIKETVEELRHRGLVSGEVGRLRLQLEAGRQP